MKLTTRCLSVEDQMLNPRSQDRIAEPATAMTPNQHTPRRGKTRLATGLLVIAAGGFATALLTGSPVALAIATGALVGGLTDWFAVEALFRRLPLPRIIRSNIFIKRREEITTALRDLVEQKVLPRDGMTGLFEGISASERIDELLDDSEARASLEIVVTDAGRRLVRFAESRGLARRLADILRGVLDEKEMVPLIVAALRTARRSPDLDRFLDVATRELRLVVTSPAFRRLIDQILAAALRSYSTEGLAKKICATMGQAFRGKLANMVQGAVADKLGSLESDGTLRRRLLARLDTWLDELETSTERRRNLEAQFRNLVDGPGIENLLERALSALRDGLLSSEAPDLEKLGRWALVRGKEGWRTLSSEGRAALDARMRLAGLALAERHHAEIGHRVADMMKSKTNDELVALLRDEVGDDLACIRITGTVLGAILGGGIFALTLLPPWVLALLPLFPTALLLRHLSGERTPSLDAWYRRRLTADGVLVGAALLLAVSPLVGANFGSLAGAVVFVLGEAGFVAGCADLFAVTALFRKIPLVPGFFAVPHTGIIHTEHKKIGAGLAALLQREVLPPEKIRGLLDDRDLVIDFLGFLGTTSAERRNRIRELVIALIRGFREGDAASMAGTFQKVAFERLRYTPLAPQARALVEYGLREGWADDILDRVVTVALDHTDRPAFEGELRDLLEREAHAPRGERESLLGFATKWVVRQAGEISGGLDYALMAEKLSSEIRTELRSLQRPGHQFRAELQHSLGELAIRLGRDEGFSAALESWKRGFLDRMDVADWLSGRFGRLAIKLGEDESAADWLAEQLTTLVEHLEQTPADRERLNLALTATASVALDRLLDLAPKLIQEQFQRNLPADQLVDFVRERLGEDLQWIRINGTAVGAVVGIALAGIVFLARLALT